LFSSLRYRSLTFNTIDQKAGFLVLYE
jgi:hypothetical protein